MSQIFKEDALGAIRWLFLLTQDDETRELKDADVFEYGRTLGIPKKRIEALRRETLGEVTARHTSSGVVRLTPDRIAELLREYSD